MSASSLGSSGACTIIAKNYLAYARVLAESFTRHNPGIPFFVLLADKNDGRISAAEEPFELVEIEQLGIQGLPGMCFRYNVQEFSTAVKPFLLEYLLRHRGLANVLYLDPDILVLDSLSELYGTLDASSVVLTPHITTPMADDFKPREIDLLQAGVYNLGFIGVHSDPETYSFLGWWQEKLRAHGHVSPESGMFFDQKWIDFAPAFLEHARILRDPGYNVAYWNLASRKVTHEGDSVRVNGEPGYFFHFSGFDPTKPKAISKHQDRLSMSTVGDARGLFEAYAKRLLNAGYEEATGWPYHFNRFDNGIRIPAEARAIYAGLGQAAAQFGDPFKSDETNSFFIWLSSPAPAERGGGPITRLWFDVYRHRVDLQAAFPDLFGRDRDAFVHWVRNGSRREYDIDGAFIPRATPGNPPSKSSGGSAPVVSDDPAPARAADPGNGTETLGINVAGYFTSEKGVGEAARSALRAISAAGIPHVLNNFMDYGGENLVAGQRKFQTDNPYGTNLINVNADQVPEFVRIWGSAYFKDRYNIGVWNWELAAFPEEWLPFFDPFDEIWVASSFEQDAVSRVSPVPVVRIPYPMVFEPHPQPAQVRERLGIPNTSVVFLFVFDFMSYFERKNPLAVIEAFRRSFKPDDDAALVIKCAHSDFFSSGLASIKEAGQGARVLIVDELLDRGELNGLLQTSDCYVSLHRSEGFGLTLAEAMAAGKPVIATGYSGNLDFMSPANSFLVDYKLVEIEEDSGPYKRGAVWAAPDVGRAAEYMRFVYEHPDQAQELGQRAQVDIRDLLDPMSIGGLIRARLERITTLERNPTKRMRETLGRATSPGMFPPPTPLWRLPLKAVGFLGAGGPARLSEEVRSYLRWRSARPTGRKR